MSYTVTIDGDEVPVRTISTSVSAGATFEASFEILGKHRAVPGAWVTISASGTTLAEGRIRSVTFNGSTTRIEMLAAAAPARPALRFGSIVRLHDTGLRGIDGALAMVVFQHGNQWTVRPIDRFPMEFYAVTEKHVEVVDL